MKEVEVIAWKEKDKSPYIRKTTNENGSFSYEWLIEGSWVGVDEFMKYIRANDDE